MFDMIKIRISEGRLVKVAMRRKEVGVEVGRLGDVRVMCFVVRGREVGISSRLDVGFLLGRV